MTVQFSTVVAPQERCFICLDEEKPVPLVGHPTNAGSEKICHVAFVHIDCLGACFVRQKAEGIPPHCPHCRQTVSSAEPTRLRRIVIEQANKEAVLTTLAQAMDLNHLESTSSHPIILAENEEGYIVIPSSSQKEPAIVVGLLLICMGFLLPLLYSALNRSPVLTCAVSGFALFTFGAWSLNKLENN
jgi:hypothetical protein